MVFKKLQKALAINLATAMVITSLPSSSYVKILEANAATNTETTQNDTSGLLFGNSDISKDDAGVYKVTMDETGYLTADSEYAADVNTPFSWDNVNMYFVITDRFENGNSSNDHSYGRSTKEKGADNYKNRIGTFHGGDLAGLTKKINEGYFDELGTNAIWITAPYEQIHGALCSDKFKHYAYHGYYVLDYTNVDANMGTEKELEEFIDTAHSHGIRVVFDIVMNHAGYADAYTANEYGFGKLADNWEEIYYEWDESQYQWYHDYAGEASKNNSQGMMIADGDWKTNWWGTSWVRAIGERLNGYEGLEGGPDDLTKCLNGLPDFKTENSGDPGIPPILKNKWTKEGNYDEKMAMTQASLKAGGLNASVTGYISAWLSEWVREYGVDGFRCDTAKHVSVSEWKKLKDSCKVALKEWRKNNPDKPGAQWTDEFWMTGEAWGHGVSKSDYFTSGAFDSMINFDYQKCGYGNVGELEGIYSGYASKINGDPDFNVLSYISSHDTALGERSAEAGTGLLLTPGGIQTYYGDESGRKSGAGSGDQPTRSHMNWDSIEKDAKTKAILSNWQKVGRFRRNHISVGAGQHKQLAASPYTFSRTYQGTATVGDEKKTDYEDKVVVCLPTKAGTYDVTVKGVFEDGTTLVDEYSGQEYTVSGGMVSATCDDNGVILLGLPTDTTPKPKVTTSVKEGKVASGVYSADKVTVELALENIKDATYQVNDNAAEKFDKTVEVSFGEDTAYEEETKIVVKGTSEIDGTEVTKEFTYKRDKEPTIGAASEGFSLRIPKKDFASAPTIWIWSGKENYCNSDWPGDALKESGDYYVYENAEITGEATFIISHKASDYRNTQEGETELSAKGSVLFDKAGNSVSEFAVSTGEACKVTVNYVDAAGKVLKSIYRVGAEGEDYTVYAPNTLSGVSGYMLAEGQDSSKKGKFSTKEETVEFVYSEGGKAVEKTPVPETPAVSSTPVPDKEDKETATPKPTIDPNKKEEQSTPVVENTVEPTISAPAVSATPVVENSTPTPDVSVKETPKVTVKPTIIPTVAPEMYEVKMTTSGTAKVGEAVTFTAAAKGGEGVYKYKFVVETSLGEKVKTQSYSTKTSFVWTPTTGGDFIITVYAKDVETGNIVTAETSVSIKSSAVVIKTFTAISLGKLKAKLKTTTIGGKGTVKYKYTYTFNGKKKVIKKYSSSKSITVKLKKPGKYKFTVYVKDSTGKVVKKTKTIKVKKK